MGSWDEARWESAEGNLPRRDRRSRSYRRYVPDLLVGVPLVLDVETRASPSPSSIF